MHPLRVLKGQRSENFKDKLNLEKARCTYNFRIKEGEGIHKSRQMQKVGSRGHHFDATISLDERLRESYWKIP